MSEAISVAVIGLAGVAIGALLTPAIDWLKTSRASRKSAAYLSVRVVCILDQFIDKCADVVGDDGTADQDGYYSYKPLPDAPVFPDDLDWRSIDNELMYEILSLPNRVLFAESKIDNFADTVGPPYDDMAEERQYEFAVLGLAANSIKDKICGTYNIPQPKLTSWDVVAFMTEQQVTIEDLRRRREENRAELLAEAGLATST